MNYRICKNCGGKTVLSNVPSLTDDDAPHWKHNPPVKLHHPCWGKADPVPEGALFVANEKPK